METEYFTNPNLSAIKNRFDDALEELVLEKLSDEEAPAMSLARDILLSGGKRFRPVLALLAHEAAGGNDDSMIMDLALASEIIHTATLIHDDIYDQSKTRRGMPTLHTSHGLSHAIIAGDYLFVIGFSIEVIADHQKTVFRAIKENKDKFISTGLWSKSQHPNYFGEILLWTSIAIMSFSSLSGTQYLTMISPIFTYVLLVYISGVRMLDDMGNKKWGHLKEYKQYKQNTPVLFIKL